MLVSNETGLPLLSDFNEPDSSLLQLMSFSALAK
jgi:hypothetical protein